VVVALATAACATSWVSGPVPVLLAQAAAVTAPPSPVRAYLPLSGRSFGWHSRWGSWWSWPPRRTLPAGLWWRRVRPRWTAPPHAARRTTDAAVGTRPGLPSSSVEGAASGTPAPRRRGPLSDDTVRHREAQTRLGELVAAFHGPHADDVAGLSQHAVEFVYLPPPADPDLVAPRLCQRASSASALRPGSRAGRSTPTRREALPTPDGSLRPRLLALQAWPSWRRVLPPEPEGPPMSTPMSGRRVARRTPRGPDRLAVVAAALALAAGGLLVAAETVGPEPEPAGRAGAVPVDEVTTVCAAFPGSARSRAQTLSAPLDTADRDGTVVPAGRRAHEPVEGDGRGRLTDLTAVPGR